MLLKYCINASKWMFKQKETYIAEVLRDLQNTNEEYNYGVLEDSFVFDVPELEPVDVDSSVFVALS